MSKARRWMEERGIEMYYGYGAEQFAHLGFVETGIARVGFKRASIEPHDEAVIRKAFEGFPMRDGKLFLSFKAAPHDRLDVHTATERNAEFIRRFRSLPNLISRERTRLGISCEPKPQELSLICDHPKVEVESSRGKVVVDRAIADSVAAIVSAGAKITSCCQGDDHDTHRGAIPGDGNRRNAHIRLDEYAMPPHRREWITDCMTDALGQFHLFKDDPARGYRIARGAGTNPEVEDRFLNANVRFRAGLADLAKTLTRELERSTKLAAGRAHDEREVGLSI